MNNFNSSQIFIVTGASSGIGAQVALTLNSLGASVVAIGRNEEKLKNIQLQATDRETFHIEAKDLTENFDLLPDYVKELKNRYGKFSGMAYCAGTTILSPINILDYDMFTAIYNINYIAPLLMIKELVNKRNNVGPGTSIVAISSIGRLACEKGQALYAGSKAALTASLKSIARELVSRNIRVNTISPSLIETPFLKKVKVTDEYYEAVKNLYPLGYGQPEDLANLVAFLLSDKAKWITGQDYIFDSATY